MKILHVITDLPRAAGTSVFVVELCNTLQKLGHTCVIACQNQADNDLYAPEPGVDLVFLPHGFSSVSFSPDVLHIHGLWSPFLHQAARWGRQCRLPVVFSPHGMLTEWALAYKKWKKRLALIAYQYRDLSQAELLHATAESEKDDFRRIHLQNRVAIVPLGVEFPPETCKQSTSVRTILFLSRVHPKKGLFNLVDAWAITRLPGWRIVIAGPSDGNHVQEVKERAHTLGVEGDFEFLDSVYGDDKTQLYINSDIFVLPTFSENFGSVVIEALACSLPVITTKGAPWAELETVQCGYWIDIGVIPLAQALGKMMALPVEERLAMGRRGRRLVEEKYTWNAVALAFEKQYHMVMEGNSNA